MIQVYADARLVYDTRLEDYSLLGLTVTTGLNKSGTAELILPPGHPAYNYFTSYRTVVTVYQDGALIFRGRALYPEDDYYKRRTITCEGERGFLQDAVIRPYLYQDTPAAIFTHAVGLYNAQVDAFKRFEVGEITVTDANDYVRLEKDSAELFAEFFNKLVERCGGYITFNTNDAGQRVINWLAEINTQSTQAIEFGENLLDYSESGESSDLATALVPYGAKLEDGTRITIESVNGGADYIQDDEAVALRGVIMATETWDDVTEPANLLRKAQQWLTEHKLAVTSLQLSAVDLSRLDRSIDGYHVGDRIRVISKPHGLNEWFQLTDRTLDLLDDAAGKITLGKTSASLTGSDVANARSTTTALERVKQEVRTDYQTDIENIQQSNELQLVSLVQQTADSIMQEVSESYATNDDVTGMVETSFEQLADRFQFDFTELQTQLEQVDGDTRTQFEELHRYIRFEGGDIILGESGNEITLRIQNDRISFLDSGAEVAYISNKQLYVTDAHLLHSLRVGGFEALPRANGNLSIVKVVE